MVIAGLFKAGQLAYRYGKTFGKFTSGETAFVGRFPPRYRGDVRTIIKGASTVTYGGLISDVLNSMIAPDSPGNGASVQPGKLPQTYKSNKARSRSTIRYRSKCPPRSYNRVRKRYS